MSNLNSLLESSNQWKSMQGDAARLASKWDKTGLLEGLGEIEKNNMSLILENQAKQLVVEPLKIDPQINFIGEVKDVTSYYNKNNIAIVPLLEGSGTRLKILEAMSFGLPVISTSIGAEGIDYIENKHIIIANDEALFQQAIIDTVNKQSILKNLASESLLLINEKYNWQSIVRKMTENLISNKN